MQYKKKLLWLPVLLFGLLLLFRPLTAQAALIDDGTIANGVWLGDIDLSGMTQEEATAAVEQYFQELENSSVTVNVFDNHADPGSTDPAYLINTLQVTLKDLGFTWSAEDSLREATRYGQSGKLIERYKRLQDLKYDQVRLPLQYSINADTVRNFVSGRISPEVNHGATNAAITASNKKIVITQKEKYGITVDVGKTTEAILALFEDGIASDLSCAAVVTFEEPQYTSADFSKMTSILGEFVTKVTITEANNNRNHNIDLEMKTLNGHIVMPGEVFSVWNALGGDTTPEKGYLPANTFSNGVMIQEEGGGVCQGNTTLYNAALFAELEIVERHPHSMVIDYVPFSRDAALSWRNKDLKFRNNTDAPIYIETYMSGTDVVARIYGHETRPAGRVVQFKTVVIKQEELMPIYKFDKSKNPDKPVVTGNVHADSESTCTKYVYQNGKLIEETEIAHDYYQPEQQTVTIYCNMLNLYVRGEQGKERIYTEDGDALLLNHRGVPIYDAKTGTYLLEKYYQVDANRFAKEDANGNPIRNNVPYSTTPKMPSDIYAEGKSAEELKNQLESMGMNVEFEYVTSSKPDGTITYVYDKDKGKQGGEIPSGSVLTKGMNIVIQVAGVPDFTISFDAGGGSGTMASVSVKSGAYTLPSCTFTAPGGKEFDKWDLGAPGASITVSGDLTLTAIWKEKATEPAQTFTVSFNAGGGSGSMSAVTVEAGSYTLPGCSFTAPAGKEFDHWDLGAPGTSITVSGDITVYAVWKDAVPPESPTAHEHSYGEWTTTKEATCTEAGQKTRRCSCGDEEIQFIDPLGHSFGEWEIVENASYEHDGLKRRTCSRCNAQETAAIPKLTRTMPAYLGRTDVDAFIAELKSIINSDSVYRKDVYSNDYAAGQICWVCTMNGDSEEGLDVGAQLTEGMTLYVYVSLGQKPAESSSENPPADPSPSDSGTP